MTTYTDTQNEPIGGLDEPLQIIAYAGSGKTQVISKRIANILAQLGVDPLRTAPKAHGPMNATP